MNEKTISEDEMGIYLYVACCNESKKNQAYMAVTKATIFSDIAINMENAGSYAFVFTSTVSYQDIKKKLNRSKLPYLLIDIGASFDLERISGVIPGSQIQLIKNITEQKFSNNKPHLNRIFVESIEKEKFEVSAAIKKIKK